MHNMDRIMNEEMGHEYGFLQEGGFGHNEFDQEYNYEGEYEGDFEGEWEGEEELEDEYGLSQEAEYELAAELLAVSSEEELDQFLGKLVRRAARGVSNFAKSSAGQALIGGLKKVAKTALPVVGKMAGTYFGGPVGGMVGGKLGSWASTLFEVNLEGMSNEDREFEIARRVVRLSNSAARRTASGMRRARGRRGVSPWAIARNALKVAASKHAPGLLTPVGGSSITFNNPASNGGGGTAPAPEFPNSGTWTRQGDQIIVTL